MGGGKLIRAFFAVEIDDVLRAELAEVIDELATVGAQVRWVRPGNLHWTLKFLGDVPLARTGEIAEIAREVCAGHRSFSAPVRGVGPFPNERKMRTLAARMDEGGRLGAIRDEMEPDLERFGIRPEHRGYKAHLTLGRVKGPRGRRELAAALAGYAARDFSECAVDELVLFQSELARGGPIYTPLAHIPLGGD